MKRIDLLTVNWGAEIVFVCDMSFGFPLMVEILTLGEGIRFTPLWRL